MLNKVELDERQLLMRGNVYQHIVILYIIILLLDGFLTSFDIKWVDGTEQKMMIMIMFPLMIGIVEMVFKDIMNLSKFKTTVILFAILAGAQSILHYIHVFIEKESIIENGILSSTGGAIVYNSFLWGIVVAYCIKYYSEKKNEGMEE